MSGLDLLNATVEEVGQQIKERQLSPVEVTRACIEQAERLDPTLKMFTTLTPE